MLQITETNYKNFGKCLKMENDAASLIIMVDAGPRIISYCLNGKENILFEDTERLFKEDTEQLRSYFGEGETWYIYGGHRLWSSPESYPYSYVPDNKPVEYTIEGDDDVKTVTLTPPPTKTGQQHRIVVTMWEGTKPSVLITHLLTNTSGAVVTMAPWALTVCDAGAVEIFPQSDADNGLLSNRRNVFWSYSDINDPRFFLSNRYGTLKQVPGSEGKFKIGINNEDGWAAVVNKGQVFIKRNANDRHPGDEYPDYGCDFETFTNGLFLECETLGSIKPMQNGETAILQEFWTLVPCDSTFDPRDEKEIDAFVKENVLPNLPAIKRGEERE